MMATVSLPAEAAAATTTTERVGSRLPAITIDKVLAILAAVLFPSGLLVILLGWYGAAHSPFLFDQVPYLISGGVMGLGLIAVGGLLYFGSWVLRLSAQQRESADQLRVALAELRDELAGLAYQPRAAAAPLAGPTAVVPPPPGGFVATAGGSMYHLPTCAVVDGHADLRQVNPAAAASMRPCRLCLPSA